MVRSAVMNVITNNANALAVTTNASASSKIIGDKLVITATETGGTGCYTYKFLVHNKDRLEVQL